MSLAGCYWLASYKDLTSGLDEDAGSDTGVTGPGTSDDGGSGAIVEDSSAPQPFCPPDAGPLTYCMDFDGVDASAIGLGSYLADAAIVSTTSVSPPSSLAVTLNGAQSSGAYGVSFPFQPVTSVLQFDMLIAKAGQWVTTLAISLVPDSPQTEQNLNVVVGPNGEFQVQEYIQLSDGGVEQGGQPDVTLDGGSLGAWHHVVLSLTVDDATQIYTSTLTVDDQVLEDAVPLTFPWVRGNARLGVGVTYGGNGGPQFFFDNVRADFTLPSAGTDLKRDPHDPCPR
jgi:hypothetical protein